MKNQDIIQRNLFALAEKGMIESRFEDGVCVPVEGIFTKNAWRKQGFKVNSGETPLVSIPIYILVPNSTKTEKEPEKKHKMILVTANFYKFSQVSAINKVA